MAHTLYLRKERYSFSGRLGTTTQEVSYMAADCRRYHVVAYRDPLATNRAGIWPGWSSDRPRLNIRKVALNCFNWTAVWLTDQMEDPSNLESQRQALMKRIDKLGAKIEDEADELKAIRSGLYDGLLTGD